MLGRIPKLEMLSSVRIRSALSRADALHERRMTAINCRWRWEKIPTALGRISKLEMRPNVQHLRASYSECLNAGAKGLSIWRSGRFKSGCPGKQKTSGTRSSRHTLALPLSVEPLPGECSIQRLEVSEVINDACC